MPRYIGFLRGINVGGHRVKMDRLRALFEQLGLTDVATFLASGNVVFESDSNDVATLTRQIERHLAGELGYDTATFLRSPEQVSEIVTSGLPDAEDDSASDRSNYVIFLRGPASETLRSNFAALNTDMDEFIVSGMEIYWHIKGKISESPLFGKGLDEALDGAPTTTRNMNTLRRIAGRPTV